MVSTAYEADHWSQRVASDDSLDQYLRDNAVAYNVAKTVLLERILGEVDSRRVLDYGGGGGYFGLRCAKRGATVTLVDPAEEALNLAERLATAWNVADRFTTLRASSVPHFDAPPFDIVILKDVIEHIVDDAGMLSRVAALQHVGGRLLLSTHNQWSLNYVLEGSYKRWWCGERDWCGWDPTHVRFYSPRSLDRLLRQAGYKPLRWASIYLVPYNIASWFTLLTRDMEWPWLSRVDYAVGSLFPFNRLGWNVLVCAERVSADQPAENGF